MLWAEARVNTLICRCFSLSFLSKFLVIGPFADFCQLNWNTEFLWVSWKWNRNGQRKEIILVSLFEEKVTQVQFWWALNPLVDSTAVGKASSRTSIVRWEGRHPYLWCWENDLVFSLLHSGGFLFLQHVIILCLFTPLFFSEIVVSSLGTNLFFTLLICEEETEKFMLVFSSSRHFSFHVRPLLISKSSVSIMSSLHGWCNTWN